MFWCIGVFLCFLVFRCSGVQVFMVFMVHNIWEGLRCDRGGAPKWLSGGEKCFQQLKKWGRPKIHENFGWGKTRTSLRGRPKKRPKFNMGKTGHL